MREVANLFNFGCLWVFLVIVEDSSGGVFNETKVDLRVVIDDVLATLRDTVYLVEGKTQNHDGLYLTFQGGSKGVCALKDTVTITAPETFDIEAGIRSDREGQRQQAENQDASFQRIFHVLWESPRASIK